MRKFLKYLRIGAICVWRVIFEYFQWILPCSRHPERKSVEYRYRKGRALVVFVLRHMHIDMSGVDMKNLLVDHPTVYVSNHQSALDPLILIALSPRPVSFIAKKEARKIPVAGRFILAIDGIFLDRDDAFQAVRCFRIAKQRMEEKGISYCLFPEGTRQRDPYSGAVLPFRAGALKLAYVVKCPIVVYAQFGSLHTFDASKGKGRLLQIRYIDELPYEEYQVHKTPELADKIHDDLASVLPELVEVDREYFAQKKNRIRPMKWWRFLPEAK